MRQANKNKWEDYLYDEEEEEVRMYAKRRRHTMQAAHAAASLASAAMSMGNRKGSKPGAKTKKRVRLDVDRLFQTMDDQHFRRKYRMDKDSFYNLLDIINEHLPKTGEERAKPGSVPNGAITHSSRHVTRVVAEGALRTSLFNHCGARNIISRVRCLQLAKTLCS
mmetsp:Transcript_420/g.639  ORF Transcript_420/g.639 Transcript_420/m.639 type:complete len:165 (+) Transcript_420:131-625(+)